MKTRPILFSTPMVQAILDGRKTQTRRIIKPQPCERGLRTTNVEFEDYHGKEIKPKYQKNDILWIRETWKPGAWRSDGRVAIDYKASPDLVNTPWIYPFRNFDEYSMKWTDELLKKGFKSNENGMFHWEAGKSPLSWRPSIFMPKEVCRIFMKVTNVRVERLQDITEEDAIAEGIEKIADYGTVGYKNYLRPDEALSDIDAIESFKTLWQSINGRDSWDPNPWVWVYTFERTEKPKNFLK